MEGEKIKGDRTSKEKRSRGTGPQSEGNVDVRMIKNDGNEWSENIIVVDRDETEWILPHSTTSTAERT